MNDIKMILVVPFYNEEVMLPSFLESLKNSKDKNNLLLLLVNHRSTDNSLKIIQNYEDVFGEVLVINESSPLRSVIFPEFISHRPP
jgi:glycosyltransferase involved in cell wall biosynthesis